MPDISIDSLIAQIETEHSDKPYIALGQSVLWDEPMKAAWRRLLDRYAPDAALIAGIHDTDYFAKTNALVNTDRPFAMLMHDDLRTRGLWSAAGEMSAFLGSEDLPTISDYKANGVAINRLAGPANGSADFLSRVTAAWGWRGIVSTGSKQIIAEDVRLADVLPVLAEQIEWALAQSADCIAAGDGKAAERLRGALQGFLQEMPADATLAQAYEALLPRLYALLLGEAPRRFSTTRSSHLFRFNSETAGLPRFAFVDLFLDPKTRGVCCDAYDRAVAGGGMYGLAEFGPGALPFDVVVPGTGRGTLHVSASGISIDLPGSVLKIGDTVATDRVQLAGLLQKHLGPEVALVGKAVALISMLASEFVIVFHETASGYTDRTAAMNDVIRAAGMTLDLAPIVRLQYQTWDSLDVLGETVKLALPAHLAKAFGETTISAASFAARWRGVVNAQKAKLRELKAANSPRALLGYLDKAGDPSRCWSCDLESYDKAIQGLTAHSQALAIRREYIRELRRERHEMRRRLDRLHREMGEHFRRSVLPLQTSQEGGAAAERLSAQMQIRDVVYVAGIADLKARIRQASLVIKALRADLRLAERSDKARKLRREIDAIAQTAEMAKLEHVRSALITARALPHIDSRPSAWWLPLLDTSGAWFAQIVDTAGARLEFV